MGSKSAQKNGAEDAYRKLCLAVADTETNVVMLNKMIRLGICTSDIKNFSLNQASLRRVYKETNARVEKARDKLDTKPS